MGGSRSKSSAPAPPSDADLRSQLGSAYGALTAFLTLNADLRPEWKYYGGKLGWNLKLFEKKRNLCFVVPHDGQLIIGFALGAKLVDEALGSSLPKTIKQQIHKARTYAEGRGVQIAVRGEKDLESAQIILDLKRHAVG